MKPSTSEASSVEEGQSSKEEDDARNESLVTAELKLLEKMLGNMRPSPSDSECNNHTVYVYVLMHFSWVGGDTFKLKLFDDEDEEIVAKG